MQITTKPFGSDKHNNPVTEYTITNASGASVSVMDLGATITKIIVPDKNGNMNDVVLGYDNAASYMANRGFLGALVGRFGNRIGGAAFTIDGINYSLQPNDGPNNLHGGPEGFEFRMFTTTVEGDTLKFSLVSPDGDQGFPGKLQVEATYSFSDENELVIAYRATTDKPTIINLTNHSYFNLDGQGAKDIKDQTLQIFADSITETDDMLIPTGKFIPSSDVICGFQSPTRIGDVLDQPNETMKKAGGVDFNYCAGKDGEYKCIAALYSVNTGREMKTYTDLPGVQIYTGQGLNQTGKGGVRYGQYGGICLETQRYPDSIHHKHFPSVILRPGEVYETKTAYCFAVR